MANFVRMHTATRVLSGSQTTTPEEISLPAGQEWVQAGPFNLTGGPWKLDAQNLRIAATQAEYRSAGFVEAFNDAQALQAVQDMRSAAQAARTAWRAVAQVAGTPSAALIKAAATAQDDLNAALARVLKAALT